MQPSIDALIFLVDDDASVREAMAWLLRSRRLPSEHYESADAFWPRLSTLTPAERDLPRCLLLDVRMPGTSGLELFDRLSAQAWLVEMPVIFLTGHADVSTAVDLVKRGAFDFCEKPSSDNALVDRVERALAQSRAAIAARQARAHVTDLVAELSERERDVMRCVVEGLPNKLIAEQLNISVRTVEVHRAKVFDKMSVKSAVELANLLRGV
ncbi:response regulator [Xenophilus arseniciresistens]|uniref:Response regulator n=1 Tax=Xenophilus arseniciresistens TaxID=1283306 RepID=A0AAE3NCQ5_9BURK|nr:response regulator [Xenophilus arseniciresistens]MDA7418406.1 response regulator [Xenophilus arseniciresistens]